MPSVAPHPGRRLLVLVLALVIVVLGIGVPVAVLGPVPGPKSAEDVAGLADHVTGRLVWLGSGMAGSGHPDADDPGARTDPSRAYADSKASDVLLADAWGRRLPHLRSVAVDPGWVKTKLASDGAPGTVDSSADSLTYLATEADLGAGLYWRGRRSITVPKHLRDEAYADALAATCDRLVEASTR